MTAVMEAAGCEGGAFLPIFNTSLMAQTTVDSGTFISVSSVPSHHCRQMALIKLFHFRFLQSVLHQKSMGQHKTGSMGIPCSRVLKRVCINVVAVSPGAEPAQNCVPCCPDSGPTAAPDWSHLLSLFRYLFCLC